ncbi:periplasmic nitrate reductase component NapD [Helicobacter heilmannii]|uniref:Chaperone NapD n=1 Tax=Helicobacter heilmannii TaxID=35817 RepID=A0A0K2XHV2_HELHE|nr:chaperone NapD [Helicobacter heilmannii]CCM11285.1 periplasmic nitrate reductase component NapD [Helicobacter heilmannii ASB1.4]CRF46876.1 periplasmic nitrate reductase component NapD [Helicobacter heilmannii]CRF49581.1 periplasmic nitrate reductase component NapD [Helicobacter heilmannii]CRI34706.1 periplasmic diheme c-type cytochrome, NapB [Helicobacter heilmannii]GMB94517.1 hypothetical protein NHP21011_06090 [Helicobacter heilmannii]
MNISSVVVRVELEAFEDVLENFKNIEHVEVGAFDKDRGVVIALIEAENVNEEVRANRAIEQTKGVISAHMHYSYSDEDPLPPNIQESLEKIENTDAEGVRYGGDVNNWLFDK